MGDLTPEAFSEPWGEVYAQRARGRGLAPAISGGRIIIPVGRPVIRDEGVGASADALARWVLETLGEKTLAEGAETLTERLSGMYAILEVSERGVSVLTDHMGFRPVYAAHDASGAVIGLGTHLESLAHACGLESDFDLVSLGELFTHNYITFPYTTRRSIAELPPCSVSVWDPAPGSVKSSVLWEPTEPDVFPDETAMRRRLRAALVEAGDDLTRGCENAAVLLSGGMDSRAVLAAIPSSRVDVALTYVTRENRETAVAGEVARAAGTTQVLVRRGDDYFPELVRRGLDLLGMELRGNCHGLCIADSGLAGQYDVVIGGQLSDTLLKDHFMPFGRRDALRPRSLRQRVRELIKGPVPTREPDAAHTTGRAALEAQLTTEIAKGVRERKERRLNEVRRVRPTTADEWQRFWPCSRQDDSAHTLGNTRLMCSDTLFAHQAIVEVARDYDPALRVDGRVTDSVFIELCGPLGQIINANTGLPANASRRQMHAQWKRDKKQRAGQAPSQDWNDVQTSWVNPVTMQQTSPFWVRSRERLRGSPALGVLDGVIARGGEVMIGSYQDDLPSTANHIAMQLALWLDAVLTPAGADGLARERAS